MDAELRLVVEVPVRHRLDDVVRAVAAARRLPVLEDDLRPSRPARPLGARPALRAVVLQAAVDVVGHLVVHADRVQLRERQLVGVVPVLPAVVGDPHAVVVAEQHVLRVLRVDPQRVVVAAELERGRPRLAAVLRLLHADGEDVDVVGVVRDRRGCPCSSSPGRRRSSASRGSPSSTSCRRRRCGRPLRRSARRSTCPRGSPSRGRRPTCSACWRSRCWRRGSAGSSG